MKSGDSGYVLIGRLSPFPVFAVLLILGFVLALLIGDMLDHGVRLGMIWQLVFLAGLLLWIGRLAFVVVFEDGRGLYVSNGRLRDAILGVSAPLTAVRSAKRGNPGGGWINYAVVIDIGGPPPSNPAFVTTAASRQILIYPFFYATPAVEILSGLEAVGVKVIGSHDDLLNV